MGLKVGVNDLAKAVQGVRVGVDGSAKDVYKMYVGDSSGAAKLVYDNEPDHVLVKIREAVLEYYNPSDKSYQVIARNDMAEISKKGAVDVGSNFFEIVSSPTYRIYTNSQVLVVMKDGRAVDPWDLINRRGASIFLTTTFRLSIYQSDGGAVGYNSKMFNSSVACYPSTTQYNTDYTVTQPVPSYSKRTISGYTGTFNYQAMTITSGSSALVGNKTTLNQFIYNDTVLPVTFEGL